jgi:hypothetical protein
MTNTVAHDASIARPATVLDSLGVNLARYGLVIVIGWTVGRARGSTST